ncbi:hypothetical protein QBC35DRAFT_480012 [Podospora australis]|uniref:Uncharacterized protein n=1 Tax=Podospora australis TaxID=1536484 RepID=A0AAN6X626_9PEZI|nr:hypothetical protein QBC35DRAFT_480012 [Podospora australis]
MSQIVLDVGSQKRGADQIELAACVTLSTSGCHQMAGYLKQKSSRKNVLSGKALFKPSHSSMDTPLVRAARCGHWQAGFDQPVFSPPRQDAVTGSDRGSRGAIPVLRPTDASTKLALTLDCSLREATGSPQSRTYGIGRVKSPSSAALRQIAGTMGTLSVGSSANVKTSLCFLGFGPCAVVNLFFSPSAWIWVEFHIKRTTRVSVNYLPGLMQVMVYLCLFKIVDSIPKP